MSTLVVDAIEDSSAVTKWSINLDTEQITTSGTTVDFTGLPSGIRRIIVCMYAVSLSGTDNFLIQLGDSGGIEATGYDSGHGNFETSSQAHGTFTAGFGILAANASITTTGIYVLTKMDTVDETWVGGVSTAITSGNAIGTGGGYKTLSAELDRIRITTVGGSNTFDAGAINIQYEF